MPLAKTCRAEPTSSMAAGAGRPETVRAARDADDEYDLGEPNAVDNAEAYERFLLGELFSSMREIPGFCGADILRRLEHDEVALITLTRFDSVAAIQTFAGDDYETPTSLRVQAGASSRLGGPRLRGPPAPR
jgi:hypothetical protein